MLISFIPRLTLTEKGLRSEADSQLSKHTGKEEGKTDRDRQAVKQRRWEVRYSRDTKI